MRSKHLRFGHSPGTFVAILLAAVLSLAAAPVCAAAETANLLPNPSFETAADGAPADWRPQVWVGDGTMTYVEEGRSGRGVRIESAEGGDLSWTARAAVEPNSVYRLSGWIRTQNLRPGSGRGALLNVHNVSGAATEALTGTQDWTRVQTVVRTGEQREIQINCLFGGWGQSTGVAWFDDLALEKIDLTNFVPQVTIQAGQTADPIHPFIYGQFIEHLGRCIYGGIWAEMLEDRKFYFPITPQYRPYRGLTDTPFPVVGASPWEILGPAEGVTMVREDSFVGEHTPRIAAGGGVRQRDLGVRAGREYVGYVWLRAAAAAPRVEAALVWGEGADARQAVDLGPVGSEYAKFSFRFAPKGDSDAAMLELRVRGGDCFVGTVSLMPADNVQGMRRDTLELLRKLDAPIYRWPGGNFVSGYNWRDGIGDRDRRPPRKNPAWTGVEHNDFGLDEFLAFCELLETEPLVVVNTGFGDAYSAAQQVEYCNAPADTVAGGWRAANGRTEPYGVKYWCVGNEMWGPWQLGFMQLGHYVLKNNEVDAAMRAVDPEIVTIASGQLGHFNRNHDPGQRECWTTTMLRRCRDHMNLISEHFYCGIKDESVAEHARQLVDAVRRKAEGHRQLQAQLNLLPDRKIPVAMTEWNYWHQPYVYGELGCIYRLRDALGVAAGLHEFFRSTDIIHMAFYAQTVNVIGCIKTTKTDAFFDATALPLTLYRREFGVTPVEVQGDHALVGLDVAAAWTADRKAITLAVVNPLPEAQAIDLDVAGVKLGGEGRLWQIADEDPLAFNEAGQPRLKVEESAVSVEKRITVPGYSINLYRLPAAP